MQLPAERENRGRSGLLGAAGKSKVVLGLVDKLTRV
jgi:hypothetical protein